MPGFGDDFISNTRNIVLSDVHTFNPTTILEGKFSYYRNLPSLSPQQLGNDVNAKLGVKGVRQNEPLNSNVAGFTIRLPTHLPPNSLQRTSINMY